MKKILKTAAVALAGTLVMALVACTDGNREFKPEEPTYFKNVSDESGNDPSVTAIWDFSDATAFPENYAVTEVSKIKPSSPADGKGNAELVYRSGLAKDLKITAGKILRVGSSTNASLTNLKDAKGSFELTLNGQSNIQIYAYSDSSGGTPSTLVAVYKKDGNAIAETAIIERNNLPKYDDADLTKPTMGIEGAAAGTYVIFANAASIAKIDVNATSQFYSEAAVTGIALDTSNLLESDGGYSKELRLAREFILPNVYLADGETVNNEKILPAKWEIVGEKTVAKIVADTEVKLVATHEGIATVRARVGRYAKDFMVKVVGTVTDFALESPTTLTMEAITESLQFSVKENSEDISKFITWEILPVSPADKKIATVTAEGKVVGSEAGKIKVKASFKDGEGNEFAKESDEITITPCDKIIVTLLDRESENFPADGDLIMPFEDTWCEVITNTTSVKNTTDLSAENFVMSVPEMASSWKIKSIKSNIEASDYPGILFEQSATEASIGSNEKLVSFSVTVTPPTDKTLKLTSVAGSFRANKKKITAVKVNGENYITTGNKDQRKFSANFGTPLSISVKTEIKFELDYEAYKSSGDKFSIGDIKLFFEKES